MELIIGGYAQGKLDYVLLKYHLQEEDVWNGVLPEESVLRKKTGTGNVKTVMNRFHDWVRTRIQKGGCPEEEILSFLDRHDDCIIISDEIGNGIVPAEPFEREYRERTGRILVQLAERAEGVERVICGIGQKIK